MADVRNQLENPQLRQVEEVEKGLSLLDDEIVLLMEGWYKTKVVYKKGWLDFKPAWWMCIMSIFTNHVYSKQINYISYIYIYIPFFLVEKSKKPISQHVSELGIEKTTHLKIG